MVNSFGITLHVLNSLAVLALPSIANPSPEGSRAIRVYRMAVGCAAVAGMVALLLVGRLPMLSLLVAPLVTDLVAVIAGIPLWRGFRAFALHQPSGCEPVRELDLTVEPERLPWYTWLGVIPLLIPAAAALYLRMHWIAIPKYPLRGLALSLMLLLGAALTAWMFAVTLAIWYGSRRSEPMRKPVMLLFLAGEWMAATMSAAGSLPSLRLLMISLGFLTVAFVISIYGIKKSKDSQAVVEQTPSECWKGLMTYNNPNDAALFVSRRAGGFGLVPNRANPWSVVLVMFPMALISAIFVSMLLMSL